MVKHDNSIDATDLPCPQPILRTLRALKLMRSGQVLRVLATGRQAAIDFHDFAKLSGALLQARPIEGEQWEYLIQKR